MPVIIFLRVAWRLVDTSTWGAAVEDLGAFNVARSSAASILILPPVKNFQTPLNTIIPIAVGQSQDSKNLITVLVVIIATAINGGSDGGRP